ncbi:alpha/beta hydrolase family protein [Aquimarina litoralis]|uniref:alpha/beta hydrolase family protein n=1 Tax=Aquimarina litoralis TaxID=584605 RepID=UPI001C5746E7|nr:alpha/beta fold hydrolase [Aquimarina litoralis]MBW1297229.1 alpha/beta fold hydrolase [Aquimarina litoralis]
MFKKIVVTFYLLFFSISLFAQGIVGDWKGTVDIRGNKLDIGFHIKKSDTTYSTTLDILAQGLSGAEANKTTFKDSSLYISFSNLKLEYEGKLSEAGEIIGNFKQGGFPIPLNLKRGAVSLNRPQEPKAPFSYYSEEITFGNISDDIQLKGTLTLPKKEGNFPLVVIVSGSGPQNRDGEMFGHKPYYVIADHLTKNGIAVFRFDERGVGESEGDFAKLTIEVSSSDVIAAIDYLKTRKEINTSKIGLIGHSIGGIVAPKVAAEISTVGFLVLLAAPGVPGDQLMLSQKAAFEKDMGLNEIQIQQGLQIVKEAYDIIKTANLNNLALKDSIHSYYKNKYGALFPENQRKALVQQITSYEVASFIKSKPSEYLEKIKIPVLALNGDKDLQVLSKENLSGIKTSLDKAGNTNVELMELKNLNHLFQESDRGSIGEYAEIEQTFSPVALDILTKWIKKQVK